MSSACLRIIHNYLCADANFLWTDFNLNWIIAQKFVINDSQWLTVIYCCCNCESPRSFLALYAWRKTLVDEWNECLWFGLVVVGFVCFRFKVVSVGLQLLMHSIDGRKMRSTWINESIIYFLLFWFLLFFTHSLHFFFLIMIICLV